jgi:hypothetical protein
MEATKIDPRLVLKEIEFGGESRALNAGKPWFHKKLIFFGQG